MKRSQVSRAVWVAIGVCTAAPRAVAASPDLRAALAGEAKADGDAKAKAAAAPAATAPTPPAPASAEPPSAAGAATGVASVPAPASAASSVAPPPPAPPASAEPAPAPAEPTLTPAPTLPAPPTDIERLPSEAYPNEPIRGIEGGSLWMTFHGQQWPTSPFRSTPPRTQLGFSGSVWVDTGYETVGSENPLVHRTKYWLQQGRLVLRATPTYVKNEWFVQGQGELVANKNQTRAESAAAPGLALPPLVDVDDLWIKAGKLDRWDVQVGRFEAWEVYHLGMGLDLHTLEREGAYDFGQVAPAPPAFYGVTRAYYRPSGVGNIAVHVYPKRFLRAELLGQVGNENGLNVFSVRPAAILDLGYIKVKGALEYQKGSWFRGDSQQDLEAKGGGLGVQLILNPRLEAGVNGAYGILDEQDAAGRPLAEASTTTYSVGGFANVRIVGDLLAGAGVNYTRVDDLLKNRDTGEVGERAHLQTFVALQTLVFDQLFVKVVAAYAKADFAPSVASGILPTPYSNTMLSGRVRLLYVF